MALWYRRSKLGFHIAASSLSYHTSKITAPKLPVSIINHNINDQLSSNFRPTLNYPVSVKTAAASYLFSSHRSSHFRYPIGSGYRRYHVDLESSANRKQIGIRIAYYSLLVLSLILFLELGALAVIYFWKSERIPYTNRKHLVVREALFEQKKAEFEGKIVPEMDPDSVRVQMVLNHVLEALQTGLKKPHLNYGHWWVKLATSHLEGLKWEVLMVKDDSVEAYCFPGGKIVMFTTLLERFNTDEEIATIIAHEVAHIVGRHAAERYTRHPWHWHVDRLPLFLLGLRPFEHRMEIEADYIGLILMASAGYDPRAAPKALEKLEQILANYNCARLSGETRSKLLSEASVMQKAVSLYEKAKQEVDT